jgi:hypothetical protein
MSTTDSSIHPLVLHGYGLVEARFESVVDAFDSMRLAGRALAVVDRLGVDADAALGFLSVRSHPATRLMLVDLGDWTGVLTNGRNGSDFDDHQHWVAASLHRTTIRVVDADERWWHRGHLRERLGYEGRIIEVRDASGGLVRSIACADDGERWTFEAAGKPYPIEATFDHSARRKRDRFTRANLHALLQEIGPGPLTAAAFRGAAQFALVAERIADDAWRARVEADACTVADADDPALAYLRRGMSFVPHMATHATSVVADLEKALRLDPTLEPRVRAYLDEAERTLRQ